MASKQKQRTRNISSVCAKGGVTKCVQPTSLEEAFCLSLVLPRSAVLSTWTSSLKIPLNSSGGQRVAKGKESNFRKRILASGVGKRWRNYWFTSEGKTDPPAATDMPGQQPPSSSERVKHHFRKQCLASLQCLSPPGPCPPLPGCLRECPTEGISKWECAQESSRSGAGLWELCAPGCISLHCYRK